MDVLPYLEHNALYNQYQFDEPWDSATNKRVLAAIPDVFRSPHQSDPLNTSYFVLAGPGTVFDGETGTRMKQIADGTSRTILLVEAKRPVPWTKPEDIAYAADKPLPKLGGWVPGEFLVAIADGSVRPVAANVDEKLLRAWITPPAAKMYPTCRHRAPSVKHRKRIEARSASNGNDHLPHCLRRGLQPGILRGRGDGLFEHRAAGVIGEYFAAERAVVFGAGRLGGVFENRLAKARGFCQADVAADTSFEKPHGAPGAAALAGFFEELLDVARNFGGQLRARFVQAEHDAGKLQPVVEPFVHQADRVEQLRQAVQSEKVWLQRQEDIVGRRQGVDREDAERRRAIDEQVVEFAFRFGQLIAEDDLATDDAGQLDFNRGQVDVRRGDPQVFFLWGRGRAGALPKIGDAGFFREQIVDGRHARSGIKAEVERGVCLRIDIHEADALTGTGERGAYIHGGGGFSDAAFLIDDGDGAHEEAGGWGLGAGGCANRAADYRGLAACVQMIACWRC